MSWDAFAYVVVPTGLVLNAMLISGFQSLINVAGVILKAPLRIKNTQISLALFMTGFCGIMATLSYSGLRRAEDTLQRARRDKMTLVQGLDDQLHRNIFYQGRNFWLSVAGLLLWAVAWRLKALLDSETFVVRRPRRSGSLYARFLYGLVALLCLAIADIPMCRLNYNLQLATFVTPKKASLSIFAAKNSCETAMHGSAQGACEELCRETRNLCDDRLWAINWARNWHVFGRWAAEAFDGTRNVQQGQARIDRLFEDRPCLKVLESTDKSNHSVNWICYAFAGLSIMGFLIAIQNVISVDIGTTTPEDTLEPSSPTSSSDGLSSRDLNRAADSVAPGKLGVARRSAGNSQEENRTMD